MKELRKEYLRFLELLRFALDDSGSVLPEAPAESEWQLYYGMARIQNMSGWLQHAVQKMAPQLKTGIPPVVLEHLESDAGSIRSMHSLHAAIAQKQSETWAAEGIEAVMIKGLETAKYYPVPELRTLGDIDWWICRPEDWQRAIAVAQSKGCTVRYDSDGDVNYTVFGVPVEHHRSGLAVRGAEGELHLLSRHVLHHALVSGLELRQIYDYAVARRALRDTMDRPLYQSLLEKDRLVRWNSVLDRLSDFLLYPAATLDRDSARLLNFAIEGGNFFERAFYFLRIAPFRYISRLLKLSFGRAIRIINKK